MPKICFLKYVLEWTFFWTNALISYWNNCRISKNEIYSYYFFYCLKYVELNLKRQEVVNLLLSFIYKPLNVLEGTFSRQI